MTDLVASSEVDSIVVFIASLRRFRVITYCNNICRPADIFLLYTDQIVCCNDMRRLQWTQFASRDEAYHVVRVHCASTKAGSVHTHEDFAELFWVEAGEGRHQINGNVQPLKLGDLCFVRRTDAHAINSSRPGGLWLVNVAFPQAVVDHMRALYFPGERRWFWSSGELPECRRCSDTRLSWLRDAASELSETSRDRYKIDRFLLNIFHDEAVPLHEAFPPGMPAWLEKACVGIHQQAWFVKGVRGLFALAGRSPEHVARVMREVMGVTPTAYVNRVRMRFAARRLEMGSQEIIDIAMDCGLSNLGHFYHLFKQEFGRSPRAHRVSRQAGVMARKRDPKRIRKSPPS